MKPYFTVFGREFAYYGILMMAGFIVAGAAAVFRGKKYGLPVFDTVSAACFAAGGGIIGAKLLCVITSIPQLAEGAVKIADLLRGGFVFYGGLIGGICGILLYAGIFKLNFSEMFDVFAVSVPLGHAFGRVGCFLAGCCYGVEYSGALSVTYPQIYAQYGTPAGVSLLPVQLIESFSLLVLYAALEILLYKSKKKGLTLSVYLICYPVLRFTLEFFRGDSVRGAWGGLSTSQWISLALFIAGICVLLYALFRPQCADKPSDGGEEYLREARRRMGADEYRK